MRIETSSVPVLAITGHRALPDASAVARSVRIVLAELIAAKHGGAAPQKSLILLSALAEGADRIAAHEILGLPGGILWVILPLPPADYERDFVSAESRDEFRSLLSRAANVETLAIPGDRVESYRCAGRHLVDVCDILVAVWDGRPGRGVGGTADVVGYARTQARPMVIINSDNPTAIVRERLSAS